MGLNFRPVAAARREEAGREGVRESRRPLGGGTGFVSAGSEGVAGVAGSVGGSAGVEAETEEVAVEGSSGAAAAAAPRRGTTLGLALSLGGIVMWVGDS